MVNTIIGEEFVTPKVQVVGYIILYFQVYAQLLLPLHGRVCTGKVTFASKTPDNCHIGVLYGVLPVHSKIRNPDVNQLVSNNCLV